MAIQSRQNLYKGINAHLHSELQHEFGGWEVFHSAHIIHLGEAINTLLPAGYLVDPEKSLQIRERHPDTGDVTRSPRPDLTIYDRSAQPSPYPSTGSAPTLVLPAIESLDLEEASYLRAIVIREITEQGELGKPITWVELLSPTNKPPNSGSWHYHEKRNATLQNGIALVEIDYLHETRSPILRLASYPDREKDSFPYTIVVTNPRPSLQNGTMEIYGFHVDDPIPPISVPLSGGDSITLDMNEVYNRTFHSFSSFSVRVDYKQLPANFESYDEVDQQHIQALMKTAADSIQ